ncbi:hypothetical protein BJF78_25250 [Pseudonocardia sp. CNS-139]|nr:hypothetical protein BJF78_25250 [Pseudonocardia sp. CNS-139]
MRWSSRAGRASTGVTALLAAIVLAACGAVGGNQGGAESDPPLQAMRPYGGDPAAEGSRGPAARS